MTDKKLSWLDPLYGDIRLEHPLSALVMAPLVQRLRHVRLSNVDSLDAPGIANISRYEHSLGVAWLASRAGLRTQLSSDAFAMLQAAALVHDSAITPFGHLVEEAYRFLGEYDHQSKLRALLIGDDLTDVGGIDRQIVGGRQTGLTTWACDAFGVVNGRRYLAEIFDLVLGRGRLGPCVSGDMDLDNLDNVVRAAYHMGLECDRGLPVAIATAMRLSADGSRVEFDPKIVPIVQHWLVLRRNVYTRFMLGPHDFAGKVMLLYAVAAAMESGEFATSDWCLTDHDFLSRLCNGRKDVREPVQRWLSMDLWHLSDLMWFRGPVPSLSAVYQFNSQASALLGRPCFGYRIKDKRTRRITLPLTGGRTYTLGEDSDLWLFGVASPVRRAFAADENRALRDAVLARFKAQLAVESENRRLL
jgi:HD superfamily phosphohydrolase